MTNRWASCVTQELLQALAVTVADTDLSVQHPATRNFTFTNKNAEAFPAAGLVVFASDPATGSFGWAALSVCPAAAGQVVQGRLGQGAVAVLGAVRLEYLDRGIDLLASGKSPGDVVTALCADPAKSKLLQFAAFPPVGTGAVFCGPFAATRQCEARAERCLALGCELALQTIPEAACAAVAKAGDQPLPKRLLAALVEARLAPSRIPRGKAGASLSPDGRPMLSAALVVLRAAGSLDGTTDRLVDLRVD